MTQKRHAPLSIQDLLPDLARRMGLDQQAARMALVRLWQQALPETFRDQAIAKGLETDTQGRQKLIVHVPHGALATEIQLMAPALCEHLNRYAPQTGVTLVGLAVKVAKS